MGFFRKEKDKNEEYSPHKTAGKVVLLDVNEIAPNPAQPRQTFDLEALKGLSDSIRVNGVLQPVLVRKSDSGDHPYELISGERRLRASKLCGNETIPAVIMDSTARQSAVFAILENIQRRDLNLFEEAAALRTLVVEWGVTQEEAAAKLGMAQSTIANKMRLFGPLPQRTADYPGKQSDRAAWPGPAPAPVGREPGTGGISHRRKAFNRPGDGGTGLPPAGRRDAGGNHPPTGTTRPCPHSPAPRAAGAASPAVPAQKAAEGPQGAAGQGRPGFSSTPLTRRSTR